MKLFPLLTLMLLTAFSASSQEVMQLWSNGIPGSIKNDNYKEEKRNTGVPFLMKVSVPTVTVFLPAKDKANGMAVVICPGGGYGGLAYEHEGNDVARWLNKNGIAGIVLKYRLPDESTMQDKTVGPLQDVQEALRLVRRKAKNWNIDPEKIGVMGFSAGGHLASTASTHYEAKVYESSDNTSARPDFSILIYPVISMKPGITHGGSRENLLGKSPSIELEEKYSNETRVTQRTPPAFLVHSTDDDVVPVENSVNYLLALKQNKVAAELHIYQKGGHGYGMGKVGTAEAGWPDLCLKWFQTNVLK